MRDVTPRVDTAPSALFLRLCVAISEHEQGLTGKLRQGTDLWDGMNMEYSCDQLIKQL